MSRKHGISVILLHALFAISASSAFRLHQDGGYELVIAVDEGETPVEKARYVQNVEVVMQTFSHQLWRATKSRFYLKSVELVVPESWADDDTAIAELGNINTADFRVSHATAYPHAKNPNLCGLPGDYVELPLGFFNSTNSNDFGPIWKTLLVLFARYRYGVWEEHGFVADERFPYAFPSEASASWEVTGCSNKPLVGKFVNISTQEDCELKWSSSAEEINSCRFVPDRVANTATASLMHFHWMESVVDFCDDDTHDASASNKQNAFCGHKSIMQVIRESPDYQSVLSPKDHVPRLTFTAVKQSSKPLLYILIDRGLIQGSYALANLIPTHIAGLLNNENLTEVVAAVGGFPNPENPAVQIKEEVGWSNLGRNINQFLEAIGTLRTDGPLERDFSKAVLEAAGKIKARNNPGGATILLIKYGADTANFDKLLPEAEVLTALNEHKIILNVIEVQITGKPPTSNFAQLAPATFGTFAVVTDIGFASATIGNVIDHVYRSITNVEYYADQDLLRTVSKQILSSSQRGVQINLPEGTKRTEFYYSSRQKLEKTNFQVKSNDADAAFSFWRTVDWNANEGETMFTYRFRVQNITSVNYVSVERLDCATAVCDGTMLGRVSLDETTHNETVVIEVSASSSVVNLASQIPLTIYAKATLGGNPIGNLHSEAIVTNGTASYLIELHDDGVVPDVLENDGIFTSYFVPSSEDGDGEYRVSVQFTKTSTLSRQSGSLIKESSMSRLLPVDQIDGGNCEVTNTCPLQPIEDGFMQVEDLPIAVVISNANQFQARPAKISNLVFNNGTYILRWKSPRVPGISNTERATGYFIRACSTQAELLNNFDSCDILLNHTAPGTPGTTENAQVPRVFASTVFVGIKAVKDGFMSDISNIVRIVGTSEPVIPTDGPETSTPTTSTTVSGQTPDPSATPDPSGPTVPTPTSGPSGPTEPPGSDPPTTTSENPSAGTTTTTKKPWMETAAGIGTIVGIIVAAIVFAGVVLFIRNRARSGSRRISS